MQNLWGQVRNTQPLFCNHIRLNRWTKSSKKRKIKGENGRQTDRGNKESWVIKKVNGGKTKAENIVKPKGKAKGDSQAKRLDFIKQNGRTILKAWDGLKGKKSGAAVLRVLPSTWHNKWIDECLMLAGLRQSGEKVVIEAVAADKSFLKDIVVVKKAANASKPKALVAREAKEAASVARFNASDTEKANNKAKADQR